MAERESGFDWKKSRFIKASILVAGAILGIGFVIAALGG